MKPKLDFDPMNPPLLQTDWIRRKFLNLPYVENGGNNQSLDIYLPDEGEGPFPVILSIHGGAFIGGDKADFQGEYVINAVREGYAVVSVNYRFSNEADYPLPVFDMKAAVRYLRAHAQQYCLDPARFAAVGASAGAYFAAMLATTVGNPAFEDAGMGNPGFDTSVQAVVGLFGVFDLAQTSEFLENQTVEPGAFAMMNYCDKFTAAKAAECRNLMPLTWPGTYVKADCPPFLIQAGTSDHIVPYENSIAMADRINAVCGAGRAVFEAFPDCDHGAPEFATDDNKARILRFIDSVLKK